MADNDPVTRAIRHGIVTVARGQLGAHYLLGAAGATPDRKDGAWYRTGGVELHANAAAGDRRDHGRRYPILFAATYRGEKYRVCAGRCLQAVVQVKPPGDPANPGHLLLPHPYKWERPERAIDAAGSVFGECCAGIRHFDCIHFVNWVLGHVQRLHYGFTHWIDHTTDVGFSDIWAGDLLTKTTPRKHIGIAVGPDTVIHASDTAWGVVETKIGAGEWDRCGRLKSSYWLRYELSPGSYDFEDDEVEAIEAD